jgi:hypothetical protein
MDGKNYNWKEFDEEGIVPRPIETNISEPTLDRMARCPYCGRFVRRGLLNFLEHAQGDCPHHMILSYSPQTNN